MPQIIVCCALYAVLLEGILGRVEPFDCAMAIFLKVLNYVWTMSSGIFLFEFDISVIIKCFRCTLVWPISIARYVLGSHSNLCGGTEFAIVCKHVASLHAIFWCLGPTDWLKVLQVMLLLVMDIRFIFVWAYRDCCGHPVCKVGSVFSLELDIMLCVAIFTVNTDISLEKWEVTRLIWRLKIW